MAQPFRPPFRRNFVGIWTDFVNVSCVCETQNVTDCLSTMAGKLGDPVTTEKLTTSSRRYENDVQTSSSLSSSSANVGINGDRGITGERLGEIELNVGEEDNICGCNASTHSSTSRFD